MLEVQSVRPQPSLRPFIRVYAQRRNTLGQPVMTTCLPRVEPILAIELRGPIEVLIPTGEPPVKASSAVVGAFGEASVQETIAEGHEAFYVFFRPSGFSRLFGVPIAVLTNAFHDARGIMGPAFDSLRERLANTMSFAERVILVDDALGRRVQGLAEPSWTSHAADRIHQAGGTGRIEALAQAYGCGVRHFERQFSRDTGFSPKHYARVARFAWAVDMKLAHPERSWSSIAQDLCYHDQMHLVHDFHRIANKTPTHVVDTLRYSRPVASK